MRIQGAVTITALQSAVPVGQPFQSIINHPARLSGIAQRIQRKVPGLGGPVVNATVAHVHHKTGGIKLGLRETFTRQPGQITRAGGRQPGQVPGNNLILALVEFAGHGGRMNRNHIRLGRDRIQVLRLQPEYKIYIRSRSGLPTNRFQLQPIEQGQGGDISPAVICELNCEQIREPLTGPGVDLVLGSVHTVPLHGRDGFRSCERHRIARDEIGMIRHVAQDPDSSLAQGRVPVRLNGASKLNQFQPGFRTGGRRPECDRGHSVQSAGIQVNAVR